MPALPAPPPTRIVAADGGVCPASCTGDHGAEPAITHLRKIPIRMEVGGNSPVPEFSSGSIIIGDSVDFVSESVKQPSMVMRAFAAAYHSRVLGYNNGQITAAFRRTQAARTYGKVEYANDRDFFSRVSEAWFGTGDRLPFVRAEILDRDKDTAELLKKMWDGQNGKK